MSRLLPELHQPHPALERLLPHCRGRSYRKHSVIIEAGSTPESLHYLVRGSVRVTIRDNGQEMILDYLNSGQFFGFGELGLFQKEVSGATVSAREDTETAEIPYERFQSLIRRDPEILIMLTGQITERLRTTSRKVVNLVFVDVAGRIARTLIELAHQPDAITHPAGMQLHITRQEIAKLVGCSREMAGRVLKDLESRGLISAHGKTIIVFGTR